METSIEVTTVEKRPFYSLVSISVSKLWNAIINIGLTPHTSQFDKKRVRLVNGICSWATLTYIGYVVVFWHIPQAKFVF